MLVTTEDVEELKREDLREFIPILGPLRKGLVVVADP